MSSLLELKDVTRTVALPNGSFLEILKGVNLSVSEGERVAIVGQSGTGKSTLLNIIGMLDLPDSGSYFFNGQDVASTSESSRATLRGDSFGFVFQQFNLFMTRSALSNVEVPLLYASDLRLLKRHALAAEMLDRVGLGDRLDSMPSEFSGGEQQRVAIARALVRRPKVILADEPTGALDLNTGKLVMELLEEVAAEQNAALIVITHDMSVAARANTVYEIIDGRLHRVTAESALNQLESSQLSEVVDEADNVAPVAAVIEGVADAEA
ncbi:ABC transporter, ATP-binding protein [Gleimia coleocanis DSM 15436]|uniref:ABC transporter, ATP-binding protein n=1 Tax=Gleimia coleocanis DSM 15436 TaxID=525245 RepID=C0W203_9ACTO|nr:ABC transporter ATP-binding protein [Gleimia coleocanis]EEH63217.1 ABC transporter, ATP-binding protein [Gleimia coleocanis DSM 15436]